MATGLWLDDYHEDAQKLQWGDPAPPVPAGVIPYTNNHSPVSSDTLSAFMLAPANGIAVTFSTLAYALIAHQSVATQTVVFVFTSAQAGQVFYGAVLVDSFTPTLAMWAILFDVPYTVPLGGGTLTVEFQWLWGDCSV